MIKPIWEQLKVVKKKKKHRVIAEQCIVNDDHEHKTHVDHITVVTIAYQTYFG